MDDIYNYLTVPHLPGGRDRNGWDCWGLCCYYYEHEVGVGLPNGDDFEYTPQGLQNGFTNLIDNFDWINQPEEDCLVLMNSAHNGKLVSPGHIGVYIDGHVLHCSESTNTVFEPLRRLESRVHGYLRFK